MDFFSIVSLTGCNASGTGVYIPQGSLASGQGTINVAITSDGKYAFVANEYGVATGASSPGDIGVVALQYDVSGNVSTSSTLLGQISTGDNAVPGLTLSPDGTRLYVTSEISTNGAPAAGGTANAILTHSGCVQAVGSPTTVNGLLTVIDTAKAEANVGQGAVLTTVNAGCSPGRAVESSDGNLLYMTARGDNRLLIFSTGMLEQNASNALLGYGDTGGTAPVGLQLFPWSAVAGRRKLKPLRHGRGRECDDRQRCETDCLHGPSYGRDRPFPQKSSAWPRTTAHFSSPITIQIH